MDQQFVTNVELVITVMSLVVVAKNAMLVKEEKSPMHQLVALIALLDVIHQMHLLFVHFVQWGKKYIKAVVLSVKKEDINQKWNKKHARNAHMDVNHWKNLLYVAHA